MTASFARLIERFSENAKGWDPSTLRQATRVACGGLLLPAVVRLDSLHRLRLNRRTCATGGDDEGGNLEPLTSQGTVQRTDPIPA